MKRYALIFFITVLTISCDFLSNKSGVPVNENIWVNGYLASWQHNPGTEYINSGLIKTDQINWSALTHLTYFALMVKEDGQPVFTLDPAARHNFNSDRLRAIVPAAHANNTQILFSVGGGGNYEGFRSAILPENRERFKETISGIIKEFGFDGVNLNMTPMEPVDYAHYKNFVIYLSATFDTLRTLRGNRPLLTVAALNSEEIIERVYVNIQIHIDQINFLTFNMVQPWRGWKAWHNAALYNRNVTLDDDISHLFPSVDSKVNQAIAAGIKRDKIGICINFHALIWSSVHIMETWDAWPTQDMSILKIIPWSTLFSTYDLSSYTWDDNALVPYINLNEPKTFISFDNERSVFEKAEYAKKKRIGGVIIWELGAGFLTENTSDSREPLLSAIRESAFKNRTDLNY